MSGEETGAQPEEREERAPRTDASGPSAGAPGRGGSRGRELLLLGVSLGVALLLGEALLRIVWHNPFASGSLGQVVRLRTHRANSEFVVDRSLIDKDPARVQLRADERSYIRPSFRYPDPDVTIAFLGGSTTECSIVQEELRFPALVSELLAGSGIRANTLNAGKSGNTLHDSLNVLLNHSVRDAPDIAVLMHATNDMGVLAREGHYGSRMGAPVRLREIGLWSLQWLSSSVHLAGVLRAALGERLGGERERNWASVARRNDPDQPEVPLGPYRARLRAYVRTARAFGIEPVLVVQPLSSSTNELTPDWADLGNQDRFNAVVREVGGEEGVRVIDLVALLEAEVPDWREPMRIFYDGMHVTDEGSRVYARLIAKELLPIAAEAGRSRLAGRVRARAQ